MHIHICRHCEGEFVCDEPLDCFRFCITCSDCFRERDLPLFVFILFASAAVAGLAWLVLPNI